MSYPKALNMLFNKKSERNQVSPDATKSNSIAKFYSEEAKVSSTIPK
jgi:hypothetical protein